MMPQDHAKNKRFHFTLIMIQLSHPLIWFQIMNDIVSIVNAPPPPIIISAK